MFKVISPPWKLRHTAGAIWLLGGLAGLLPGCTGAGSSNTDPMSPPPAVTSGERENGSGRTDSLVTPALPKDRDPAARLGSTFRDWDLTNNKSIRVRRLTVPEYPGASAIWGGTGRDDLGHVWIGGCTWAGVPEPSAHVFRIDPGSQELRPAGDVVSMLKKLGVHRPGEGQMKIHSKFVPMDDGWIYFASMDEQGENEDGSRLPTWGSHLWRMRPDKPNWEKLLTVPEGLIAVSGVGRYVFSLGYFGHVVYRYDTQTGETKRKEVGSYGGHISRNLLADGRGHAFVPRIVEVAADNPLEGRKRDRKAELVELDHDLNELESSLLANYPVDGTADTHGITGIAYLADGSLAFTTSQGALYRILPREDRPSEIRHLGWFHPAGAAYAPALVSFDGRRFLSGLSSKKGSSDFDWVTYDLTIESSVGEHFPIQDDPAAGIRNLLLYGSLTQDSEGNAYVVGRYINTEGSDTPICLQVRPSIANQPD